MESFSIAGIQFLGFLVIVNFPPIIKYFFRITNNSLLWGCIFILAFISGSLELFGIPSNLTRFARELIIVVVAIATFSRKGVKMKFPYIGIVALFIVISVFSSILNDQNFLLLLLFLRKYLLLILFFYTIINYPFKSASYYYLDKLIIGLVLAQIIFSLIKFALVGVTEPIIGTMSVLGGSFTTIFGLTGLCISTSFYLITKKKKYLLLAFGFLAFSLIGGKRAMFAYAPLVFLAVLFFFRLVTKNTGLYFIKKLFLILIVASLAFYLAVRLSPTLNPERHIWGSFDIEFLVEYSDWYLNDYTRDGVNQSRGQASTRVFQVLENYDFHHLLFGLGAGHLIESDLNPEISKFDHYLEFLVAKYNLGYGIQTGFLMLLLQTGLLGASLYFLFFIGLFRDNLKIIKKKFESPTDDFEKSILLSVLGLFFIFFLIFGTYTNTIIDNYAPNLLIIWILGFPYRKYNL